MKHLAPILLVLLAAAAGCRRADIRTCIVEIPSLTAENTNEVVKAFQLGNPNDPRSLRTYEGVDTGSFVFDLDGKTLTLRYDSMKIAQTNIRMLIEAKGLEVVFPENTTGRAGY